MSITIPEPLPISSPHSVPVSREEVVASTSSLEEENKQEEKEDQEELEEEEVKEMDNQLREMEEPIETPITREDEEGL